DQHHAARCRGDPGVGSRSAGLCGAALVAAQTCAVARSGHRGPRAGLKKTRPRGRALFPSFSSESYFAPPSFLRVVAIAWKVVTIWPAVVNRKNLSELLAHVRSTSWVGSPPVLTCTV